MAFLLLGFFVLLLLATFAVVVLATRPSKEEKVIEDRITDIRNPRRALHTEIDEAGLTVAEGGLSHRLGRYLQQYSVSAKVETLLVQADSQSTIGSLVLTSLTVSAMGAMAGLLLLRSLPLGAIGCLLGLFLPLLQLKRRKSKRVKKATEVLPEAADLIARALRSGHSMTQTIELVGEQAPQPLGAEFARVFQEQKLGVPLREVLVDMCERLPSRDLHFLVTAILVQKETGGDLAAVLDRTAHVLRERIQLQAQVQIHTAQGRLTGWILSSMPVILLTAMVLFSPNYANSLFHDPLGRKLLYAGAGFILTGGLIIRKIVGVQV